MIGSEDPDGLMPLDAIIDMFGRAIPVLDSEETISDLEITTRMWARVMGRCLEMQSLNIPMFVFRYEELSHSPRLVLDALFEYCGIAADAVGDIDSVLAQDSQAGSQLARETIAGPSAEFTSLHLEKIRSVMDLYTPGVSPDSILPGTYFPV